MGLPLKILKFPRKQRWERIELNLYLTSNIKKFQRIID
jgi:hypothetical protein